jgi:hypothetical protein
MVEIWQKCVVYVLDKYKQDVFWSFSLINVNSKNNVYKKYEENFAGITLRLYSP